MENKLYERQTALVEANIKWLRQVQAIIQEIDDQTFSTSPQSLVPHRVGGHLRHIMEFYECFLDGLSTSHIDYDARKRDEAVERSRAAAAVKIGFILHRLETTASLRGDCIVWVRLEGYGYLTSSVGRELHVLSSHTVHHFALIAMTLKAHGVAVDPDFGMAPSTLRYLAARAAA
ncbi:MAG: hypothetical protein ABJF23_22890 [Bryobacteraceae bacterium]